MSKFISVRNSPTHSTHLDSLVVQVDLISFAEETNISNLLSKSPEDSAIFNFVILIIASSNIFCSFSSYGGQLISFKWPSEKTSTSSNLSYKILASGLILPFCNNNNRRTKFETVTSDVQYISSITTPSSLIRRDNLQS